MFRTALVLGVLAITPTAAAAAPRPGSYGERLGGHSMVYLNSSPAEQEAMFRVAAEAGVRYVRMDFAVGLVFARDKTDFSAVDRVNALAGAYDVEVLGVITHTPWYIAACPGGGSDIRCGPGPRRGQAWLRMVRRIARRATNVRLWELGNEPDNPSGFVGGAAAYARWAALAADGIRAARPNARIAFGGLSRANGAFVAAALHDPTFPLVGRIDIANVHVRTRLDALEGAVGQARAVNAQAGFDGPLWVTETGYPSHPSHQWEPGFPTR